MSLDFLRLRAIAENAAVVSAAASAVREVWSLDVPAEVAHHIDTFDPPTVLAILDELSQAWERGHFYCAAEQGSDIRCANPYGVSL